NKKQITWLSDFFCFRKKNFLLIIFHRTLSISVGFFPSLTFLRIHVGSRHYVHQWFVSNLASLRHNLISLHKLLLPLPRWYLYLHQYSHRKRHIYAGLDNNKQSLVLLVPLHLLKCHNQSHHKATVHTPLHLLDTFLHTQELILDELQSKL